MGNAVSRGSDIGNSVCNMIETWTEETKGKAQLNAEMVTPWRELWQQEET